MKVRMAAGLSCVMLLAAVVFVQAQETAAEKPRKQPAGRLTQPWNKIPSLSDEQKTRIREIHGKAVAEIRAIQEREREEIMALLTDEQKAEAERLIAEQRTRRSDSTARQGDPSNEKKVQEKAAE